MRPVAAATLLAALCASAASAQPVRVPVPRPATAAEAVDPAAIVAEVRRIIAARYVLPERRPALDAVLAEGLSSGRYRTTDPNQLADRINDDLARVGHDRHLNFRYVPGGLASAPGARTPNPADDEAAARRRNYGIRELRLLPGNIRYMAYDGFEWTGPATAAALDNALRFLRDGDAVIIDLRRNGGGSPDAVQYLVSPLMEANRPLMSFYMNGSETADRTATLAEVPAGRMISKPLYVLTSRRTASAAEEFSGHVAGFHLGELVGENTAGAGFRNEIVGVGDGFRLSVSVGRAVLAATGRDWEAVGHAPTLSAPVDQALEAAQVHALRRLAAAAAPGERARIEAAAALLDAQLHPVSPALPLASYTGRFGERVIALEGGKLTYRRGDGPKLTMVPVGANAFAFEEDAGTRIEFAVTDAAASGFDIVRLNGPRETLARTGAPSS